jgi:hypothetical protein
MPKQLPFPRLVHMLIPAIALFLFYTACQKSDFQNAGFADHNSEFAFPLFTTDITLKDLMKKIVNDSLKTDTLRINNDGTMTIFYTGDVAQKPATDIFKFFENGGVFVLPDTNTINPLQAPSGVTIYEADLKSGYLGLSFFNTTSSVLHGTFWVPQMQKNGVPFSYDFVLPPNSTTVDSFPVKDYVLKSNDNTIQFRYHAFKPDNTPVILQLGFIGGVWVSFKSLKFNFLKGYWGYTYYPLTRDTINININQTNLNSNVKIKNPKVTMRVSNSWGFPTRGTIKYLSFIAKNGQELPLKTTAFYMDTIVDFNWPSYVLGEVGQTKYKDITLDETNSNIADIFNSQPVQFIYEVNGISNATKDPNIIGFMTDSSVIKLSMRVELLLEGSAQDFRADQTLDLNFGDYAGSGVDTAKISDVEFKLVTENGTPIAANLQIYFQDASGNTIDSLFTGGPKFLMQPAPVDAQGIATGITRTENYIDMTATRFQRIRKAKKAFMSTGFTTANGGTVPVKLLADNKAKVKMGMKVKVKL